MYRLSVTTVKSPGTKASAEAVLRKGYQDSKSYALQIYLLLQWEQSQSTMLYSIM
jgi:hypothetical protein